MAKKTPPLTNSTLPIHQYNFKSFICTIIFPLSILITLHFILYALTAEIQLWILDNHPTYQFDVWTTLDQYDWGKSQWYFGIIYFSHTAGDLFLPIVVAMMCGRKTFNTYLKCSAICYVIGVIIFLCFPVVDYLKFDWYHGPGSVPPPNFKYEVGILAELPSFHCLVALCPVASMLFIKIDQKAFKKGPYFTALVLMIVYYILIQLSTIATKNHYAVDGFVSIGIVAVVFGLNAIIFKQKNGLWLANLFEKFYVYVDDKKQQHRAKAIICIIIIFLAIFLSISLQIELNSIMGDFVPKQPILN